MKHIQLLIFFLLLNISVKAQKVPYEKLEAFSKEISQIQLEANGKSYNDGTNDIEISFPEENFTVLFNSQLATNVVYKKSGSKELMYLTENISLGRVVGFTSEVMDNNIVVWKINFGKFTVTTQIFEDGKLIDTTYKSEMILYSYINSNKKATDPTFFKSFSELCNTMKKSIGMITDKELESENKDWEDKSNTMVNFVKKHPNSVRTMQGKNMIANKEKAELKKKIEGEENFMKYYYFKYYTIGQTLEEAKAKYPDFYKKTEKYKYKNNPQFDKIYTSSISGVKIMVKNEKVVGCWAYVQGVKNDDSNFTNGNKAISELINELKNEFFFEPKVTTSNYNQNGTKFDTENYTWEKNGKSIVVGYIKWYYSNGYTTEISLTQIDPIQ
jgi:hypothetical protein